MAPTLAYRLTIAAGTNTGFDDECSAPVRSVDLPVEADRTSHAWPLTLHGCSVGTDTLTARLYEVHEEDSETERTSVEAEVTVTPPRMYAPAVTAGGGSVDVYWTELSAEHAITRYVVRHKLTADPDVPSSWTPSSPAAASDPKPKTLTGLSNRSYDVQIRGCTNDNICGPWSESTAGTPVPVITIEAQQSEVTEGDNVVFTLKADPVPEGALTVRVDVSQMPRGADFLDGAAPTEKKIASGSATAELRVRLDNDNVDEEDGKITVIVQAGTGYVIASPPPEASVAVLDNDVPPAPTGLRANGNLVDGDGDGDKDEVTLRWNEVTGATDYNVRYVIEHCGVSGTCEPDGGLNNPNWQSPSSPVVTSGSTVLETKIGDLALETLYRVEVQAVVADTSDWSDFAIVHTTVLPLGTARTPLVPTVATAPFYGYRPENAQSSHEFRYVVCGETITPSITTSSTNSALNRSKLAIISDINDAVDKWEDTVLWYGGGGNIISTDSYALPAGDSCADRSRGTPTADQNQVVFVSNDELRAAFCIRGLGVPPGCFRTHRWTNPFGEIAQGAVLLRASHRANWNTIDKPSGCTFLHQMVVHEVGHAFGIGAAPNRHPANTTHSIMSYDDPSGYCEPQAYDIVAVMANYQSR